MSSIWLMNLINNMINKSNNIKILYEIISLNLNFCLITEKNQSANQQKKVIITSKEM
jgi:hypothetical protein